MNPKEPVTNLNCSFFHVTPIGVPTKATLLFCRPSYRHIRDSLLRFLEELFVGLSHVSPDDQSWDDFNIGNFGFSNSPVRNCLPSLARFSLGHATHPTARDDCLNENHVSSCIISDILANIDYKEVL